MSLPNWFVAVLVGGAGLTAFVWSWVRDTRLERRQGRAKNVGVNIFRSNREDASAADLFGLAAAIRAQPDLPLSAPPPPERHVTIAPSPLLARRTIGAAWKTPAPAPLRPLGHGPTTLEFAAIAERTTGRPLAKVGPRERPAWASSVVTLREAS